MPTLESRKILARRCSSRLLAFAGHKTMRLSSPLARAVFIWVGSGPNADILPEPKLTQVLLRHEVPGAQVAGQAFIDFTQDTQRTH